MLVAGSRQLKASYRKCAYHVTDYKPDHASNVTKLKNKPGTVHAERVNKAASELYINLHGFCYAILQSSR